jgi:asparagine synthase (glutamine-hydrolysing)
MCGICGIVYQDRRPVDKEILERMTDTLRSRGPDDAGYHLEPGAGFGHRRLSVIDLENGQQPIYNENRTLCVLANGEIYNYRELRRKLEAGGHVFRTRTDTEVVAHLSEEEGVEGLTRLNGMYAFAVWDTPGRRLTLVRDRVGKKPLYYAEIPGGLVFASQLKTLLTSGTVTPEIHADALSDFISLNYTLAPDTMIRQVKQLPPGHYLQWTPDRFLIRSYWSPNTVQETPMPEQEAAERLYTLLDRAVQCRLVSDAPVGAFLSGGIDSSAVVAFMTRHSAEPIRTFSAGFREKTYDERPYSRLAAERLGACHHEIVVDQNMAGTLPDLVWGLDEPFGDASALPLYVLARFARPSITVALSGDGADEILGGYPTLQADRLAGLYRRIPAWARRLIASAVRRLPVSFDKVSFDLKARQFVTGVEHDRAVWHYYWRLITTETDKKTLIDPDMQRLCAGPSAPERFAAVYNAASGLSPLNRQMIVDMHTWLANDILTKVDRATMAHGLEVRCPFLDHHLIEFAFGLPFDLKVRGRVSKYLLKRALRSALPSEILRRKKAGFNVPVSLWLNGSMKPLLLDTLSADRLNLHGLFQKKGVERLIREHNAKKRDHGLRLWGLLCFQLWYEQVFRINPA